MLALALGLELDLELELELGLGMGLGLEFFVFFSVELYSEWHKFGSYLANRAAHSLDFKNVKVFSNNAITKLGLLY